MAITVYIAGLPASANDNDVQAIIKPYGEIRTFALNRDAATGNDTKSAFVEMVDDAAAYDIVQALNGVKLDNRMVHADLIVSGDTGMAPRGAAGPARTATVQEATLAWERLEAWLKVHAYEIWYSLNPVAMEPELQAAEAALGGIRLPIDLRVAYHRHNGQNPPPLFAGGFRFCALLEVEDRWRFLNTTAQQLGETDYWHPLWIPLTESDSGDCQFLNLNPEDPDCGRIFFWSAGGDTYPIAENFTAFVEDLAEGLETARYFADNTGVTDSSTRWL